MDFARYRRPLTPFLFGWFAMACARIYFEGASAATYRGILMVVALTTPFAVITIMKYEKWRKQRGSSGA